MADWDVTPEQAARLKGLPSCNRWQASTGEWCRLAADDIVALRALKIAEQEKPR
jgi:hypothetical protein